MSQTLFKVRTIEESLKIFRESFNFAKFFKNREQLIELIDAYGRVLAENIVSSEDIPGFNRATVDGFAVKASDTYGASDSLPAYLELVGEIKMSVRPSFLLQSGQTSKISTGWILPEGADAVVML